MSPQLIADLMTTCFEGGSNFWLFSAESVSSTEHCSRPWYADPAFYTESWSMIVIDDEGDRHTLDQAKLDTAWPLLDPARAAAITENDGQWDAEDSDCLLQIAVFGAITYG